MKSDGTLFLECTVLMERLVQPDAVFIQDLAISI